MRCVDRIFSNKIPLHLLSCSFLYIVYTKKSVKEKDKREGNYGPLRIYKDIKRLKCDF